MLCSLLSLFLGIFSVIEASPDFTNLRLPSYHQYLPGRVKLLITPYAFSPVATKVFPQNQNENKQYVYYYSPTDVVLHKNHKSYGNHSGNKKREFPYRFTGYQRYPKKVTSLLTQARRPYPKVPAIYMRPPAVRNNLYPSYKKPSAALKAKNHRYNNLKGKDEETENDIDDERRLEYERDHAPEDQNEVEEDDDSEEVQKAENDDEGNEGDEEEEPIKGNGLELSPDGDRVEFQIQGHEGPQTYIFGYDTGDGKNRQFRLEERLKDGTVKGHYGYYDARGKLRAIKYVARPSEGYQEKHHESNS